MPNQSSTRLACLLLSLGGLFTLWPQLARAQSPRELSSPAPDPCLADPSCKVLADRGLAEYGAQQNEAALASFRSAFALHPVPWLLFNIGRVHQKQGRTDEALAAYRAYVQQSQAADEAWQREKARVYIEQIQRTAQLPAEQAPAATPVSPQDAAAIPIKPRDAAAIPIKPQDAVAIPTQPLPPEQKPIYKKWWFWTLVGGAAAVVAVGTAIGVAAREPDLTGVMQYRPLTP